MWRQPNKKLGPSGKHTQFVIPAKAGIQCGSKEERKQPWIPAFAGMTIIDALENE